MRPYLLLYFMSEKNNSPVDLVRLFSIDKVGRSGVLVYVRLLSWFFLY